jgi:CHAT domain-containing protein
VDIAGIQTRLGRTFWRQGHSKDALPYLDSALTAYRKAFGHHHKEIARTLLVLANASLPDTTRALRHCHEAMVSLHYDTTHPTDFSQVWAPVILLEALTLQGQLRSGLAFRQGRLQTMFLADRQLQAGIYLIDHILSSLEGPGSRQLLTDDFFKLFEAAILTKFRLQSMTGNPDHWQEAFLISERSNAALLLEAVLMADVRQFSDVPDSLVQLEHQRRIDLYFHLNQLAEAEPEDGEPSPARQVLQHNVFEAQRAYSTLLNSLKERYPSYYRLRHIDDFATVQLVQQDILADGQAMVSYFAGEDHLFAFVIEPHAFHALELPMPTSLVSEVLEFQQNILAFDPLSADALDMTNRYARQAHRLYQLLLEPLVPLLSARQLVLLPGGILGYLPFEALLTTPPNQPERIGSYDFVIRTWQITYAYSATLLDELKKRPAVRPFRHKMAAFAPSYDGRSGAPDQFPPLRFNRSEAETAIRLFGGSSYTGSSATLANFLSTAPGTTMLHLAAHGKSDAQNGDNSFIAFYKDTADQSRQDHLLLARDLYNLRIQAALVVLSACETGTGNLQRGEGIISLARGFFYAGASCLVTTLWRIDDVAAQSLMLSFYHHLRSGQPVDGALRLAKLDFLQQEEFSLRAHPLFWAAFVPSGNTNAVVDHPYIPWLWFGGFLLLAFSLWRHFLRNRRQQAS